MGGEDAGSGQLLFIYGSLLLPTGDAQVDAAMKDAGPSLGRGYIHARLFDLGDYPGAKPVTPPSPAKAAQSHLEGPKVWGRLFSLKNPGPIFAVLDPYEGFNPRAPLTCEFVRSTTAVVIPETGRTYLSQVYFFNQPVKAKRPIPSGDYLAYKYTKENSR